MRRARSLLTTAMSIGTPAGKPSTTAVRPGPCDSPVVRERNAISPALATLHPQPVRGRQRRRARGDDARRDEDEQLLVVIRGLQALEEPTQHGNTPQVRQARLALVEGVAEDATQHHGLAVLDEDVRGRLAADLVWDAGDRAPL